MSNAQSRLTSGLMSVIFVIGIALIPVSMLIYYYNSANYTESKSGYYERMEVTDVGKGCIFSRYGQMIYVPGVEWVDGQVKIKEEEQ